MQQDLVGLAFAAGLVAALNPCGFAMLPAYLALVVRGGGDRGAAVAVGRAVAATAAMTLGFLAVFGIVGLLTVSVASRVSQFAPYLTVLVGVTLVALGIWLATGRELALPNRLGRGASWAPTSELGSMFGYGIGYAIASLSCTIGPFLAVTGAGVGSTTGANRVWIYLAYAAGFGLVVGALAVAVALAGTALVDRARRILPYINRIGGVVLILVGLYVGYYGYYEVRLFHAGGRPGDPVIAAAGRLQGSIAGWVHRHGPWPWIAVLATAITAALAWGWYRRRSRAGPATADVEP